MAHPSGMVVRLIIAGTVTLVIAAMVVTAWVFLNEHEIDHYAELAEAESYATRSHLVKEIETQLRALREVAAFWSTYGHLPKDQWDQDAQIELSHFGGLEQILWSDPERGIRYATSANESAFDHRPSDEQWETLQKLFEDVDPSQGEMFLGPVVDEDNHPTFRIQVPAWRPGASGVLVARVDVFEQLKDLLQDRSPKYAISISWEEVRLYQRGEPAEDIPEEWVREGLIELSMGPLWRVAHAPTAELAESFKRPAVPGLLATGLIIAALTGFLVFQNGRVRERAIAAERAEKKVRELNAELTRKVNERTQELAERTADLETISESVAHDLRNPMQSIGLSLEVLRQRPTDRATVVMAAQRIEHANAQAMDVLQRLYHFSQVSFVAFERQDIDMNALVMGVCNELSGLEPPPPPRIDIKPLSACRADTILVKILFLNLLSNALKYTRRQSERRIKVGAEAGRDYTTYFVSDNGPGFEADKAESLFEPFARLGGEDSADGQGVGLAIAARVVRRHGGEIWAEGSPGAGATFYFHLGSASKELPTSEDIEDTLDSAREDVLQPQET